MQTVLTKRRMPVGAEPTAGGGTHFRVWAPKREKVEVVLLGDDERIVPLEAERGGYFSGFAAEAEPGDLYRYRLDGDDAFPDPASRFQPEGPHGSSQIIDPHGYEWQCIDWPGISLRGQVVYEMHLGTFTPEGTYASAIRKLPLLAETGITVLELMPLADFAGQFGWGYDGVNLFAPTRLYGSPDNFRRFVDEAHRLGMGVILDVVYNHFGPDGNYLREFSDYYFSTRYKNEWGDPINFDDEHAGPVREFFTSNAAYWIEEFRLDGLRLDATQQIFDVSTEHILSVIGRHARNAAGDRSIILVAENERQEARAVRPLDDRGYGLDGMWNDDFHHSACVALTGRNEAYYTDYQGTAQELLSAVKWGFLYQGQRYSWQKARRGYPALDLRPEQFITFLENHDQVSNCGRGYRPRLHTSPAKHRAMTALLLLAPGTPMLFQGQEFGATSPFWYFADHRPDLAKLVAKGRAEFMCQFPSNKSLVQQGLIERPDDPQTFQRCKLDWRERDKHAGLLQLHKDLLTLRREDPAFRAQQPRGYDGAVLNRQAFLLRFFVEGGNDRLLIVNLGPSFTFDPSPEPLLAPPMGKEWKIAWSSESPKYGGIGMPPFDGNENRNLPAEVAMVLVPVPIERKGGA